MQTAASNDSDGMTTLNRGNGSAGQELANPVASAEAAGLRYVVDSIPGIRRRRAGKGFHYVGPDGKAIRNPETLQRIKALAIPPAWTDVWISPDPNGHLQATGRDAKGRKQYRYHTRWRQLRDVVKYDRMLAFGEALPKIRERTAHDLALPGMPREKVLATVVELLEKTRIRVGNEEYRREYESFGLTTLRDDHVRVSDSIMSFDFRGKGGKWHRIKLASARLARVVRHLQELPGYVLFQYVDEKGVHRTIESQDVNDYLRQISGGDFTAKDFRTWAGTVIAARYLRELEFCWSERQCKQQVAHAVERVAEELGNTPTVCRKCYIHPGVIDAYVRRQLGPIETGRADGRRRRTPYGLSEEEQALLEFLRSSCQLSEGFVC